MVNEAGLIHLPKRFWGHSRGIGGPHLSAAFFVCMTIRVADAVFQAVLRGDCDESIAKVRMLC